MVGAVVGKVITDASRPTSGQARTHAEDRRQQRDGGGDHRAEHQQEQYQRADQADDLGLQVVGDVADLPGAAAVLDLQAGRLAGATALSSLLR